MNFEMNRRWAESQDEADELREFQSEFHFPKSHSGNHPIYLVGNSLGLQPKTAMKSVAEEMKDWRELAIEGHLHGTNPWYPYHEFLTEDLALLVGAKSGEVVAMNSLTVNLHLAMVSFYRPTKERYKILIEGASFPSDRYAVESQMKLHGVDPKTGIVELFPRTGEKTLRTEDIVDAIGKEGPRLALVLLGQVQYLTGQAFRVPEIEKASHAAGAYFALDLAHGAGNLLLKLHDWNVDFAVWCSYKFLNSGPGGVGGLFVHEKHRNEQGWPRLAGWWGHDKTNRFLMGPQFSMMKGVEGWQLSNPPIMQMALLKASLEQFRRARMERLRKKSEKLTSYLEFSLREKLGNAIEIITPKSPDERGCSLAIEVGKSGKKVVEELISKDIYVDFREPGIMRIAPVPLYNSFLDVFSFVETLGGLWKKR